MPATTPNIRTIFDRALEIASEADRRAFLAEVCPSAEIRGQVEALLAAHAAAGSFLETPPTAVFSASETARAAQAVDSSLSFLSPSDDPASLGWLGHYEIEQVVGAGGFGVVLKARDTKLDRIVAVKTLAQSLASSAQARQRFVREAKAAAAVKHDNVVGIHAVSDEGPVPYLVMEFVSGVSLEEKLQQAGMLDLPAILRIGSQIASGLAAAHQQGLVHRDVKPANILLENGVERVKITDFGLARAANDVTITREGEVAGTPQYMSPEQALGQPLDSRSDLFSLGSVLYAACTGHSPFRAASAVAALRRVCDDTPRPIREMNPEIPDWLVAIVSRLLAKQPDERFQTAAEVADLLGQHLAELQHPGLDVKVRTRSETKIQDPKSRIRGRWIFAAVAAVALVLLSVSLTEATGLTHFAPTLLRIVTGEGTLLVEVNDPAVKITVEGDGGLVITGAGLHEVHLKPGKYQLRADKGGQPVPLNQELVTIIRGKEEVVRVRLESPATARPAAAVPLDPARPFVLLSPAGAIKRQLAGLQPAISEAASGDIIEICGDGPYLTPPASTVGKALSIRAGQGFHPVLKLDLSNVAPEAKVTMLRTTAPLVVEGIEFHVYRSGLLPPPKINSPLGQCTCLQADAALLRVANCRFLGLGNVLAIDAHYTPNLEIRNSLLLSGNNALFASLRGPAQVRIENNLILADIAPLRLHVDGREPDQTSVSITRNTLLGYYAITWLVHEWEASLVAQSKSATKLSRCEVAENLCCSQVTQALFNSCFDFDRPVKPGQPNPDELQRALRTLIEWNERDNGYSDHPLSSGQLVSTTDVSGKMHPLATTLDDWNAFWGLQDTGSAVGAVRFIDGDVQQLLRSSKESLLPASFLLKNDSFGYRADKNQPNLGADVSLVGPGAAYERWRSTPAYEEWRRTTNQTGQARAESRRNTNQAGAAPPKLLTPALGAVLPNGAKDRTKERVWEFTWAPVPGASQYHLHVIGSGAPKPMIEVPDLPVTSYRYKSNSFTMNLKAWRWKVRALVDSQWTEWSEARTFEIQPPATATPAFVVLSGAREVGEFRTLSEALSVAGDIIEIRGNGPFTIQPINLKSRRVIRAGTGFRPVLKIANSPAAVLRVAPRIASIAPLILEGLEIQSALPDGGAAVTTMTDQYGSVPALFVANCRLVHCGLLAQHVSACQVRNCEVEGIALIHNKAPLSAVIDNNICLQMVSMHASVTGGILGLQELVLTRNALARDLHLNYFSQGNPAGDEAKALSVKSTQNVWFGRSAAVTFHLSSQSPVPTEMVKADKAEALMRRVCGWSPQLNVYPKGVSLLSLAHGTSVITPTRDYQSLAEWNQFWDVTDAASLQGTIRCQGGDILQKLSSARETVVPEDFRLMEGSPGYRVGPDGKDLGPDLDLVGPGSAYERWKQTPEYQEWLKDTGQLRAEIPPPQPGASAFVIPAGKGIAERKFDTLAEAVLKSSEGDTIEVRGNGPFVTPQLTIATALTIRAGAGYRPVIQAAPGVESARPPRFVVARGPLTLEGLEFQGLATGGSDCTFDVQDAPCYVANCQFRRCWLRVTRAPGYQVRNSHFSTTGSTALSVANAVPPGPTQVVDNNLITNLLSASGPGARIDIRRNLIMGTQGSVAVAAANPSREQLPVGLHLSQNIFVGSPVLRFSEAAAGPLRTTAASGAELEAVLRTVIHWQEDGNLYSEGARFFTLSCATGRTSFGGYVFSSVEPSRPYGTLAEWNEFWGQSDTGAIQGRVQFQGGDAALAAPFTLQPDDFRLRSDSAGYRAGPDGKDLGPDIDFVGPGPAYERWKTTPEYQKWLEESKQKQ